VERILPARRNRPLVLVDIAVPRDIDPAVAKLPDVFLYDIDDLEAVVRENTKNREQELVLCQQIIAEHAAELMARFESPIPRRAPAPVETIPGWALEGAMA
jgi:glutamyl-tRNA reductase